MEFRSKVDRNFVIVVGLIVLVVGGAVYFPLWLEGGAAPSAFLGMTAIFLGTVGFIFWCSFSVKYVFREDHLFVKGGPFRSRIPYDRIRKVSPTRNIFTGYRILSSFDAIEIFYDKALLGSVKISPHDTKKFLAELKKRCPHVQIQK